MPGWVGVGVETPLLGFVAVGDGVSPMMPTQAYWAGEVSFV